MRSGLLLVVVAFASGLLSCGRTGFSESAPKLLVEPGVLRFVARVGEVVTPQSVAVSFAGGGARPWRAVATDPWISANPNAAMSGASVQISVATTGLAPGFRAGLVRFLVVADATAGDGATPNAQEASIAVELMLEAPGWEALAGPGTGHVTAVAAEPSDAQHLLAGTDEGLVYASDDGGASFTPILSGLGRIGSIVLTPSGRGYLGTQDGVYVTLDGGHVFDPSGLRNVTVASVAASLSDDAVVLASIAGALWRSKDAGSTWVQVPTSGSLGEVTAIASTPGWFLVAGPRGMVLRTDGTTVESFTTTLTDTLRTVVELPSGRWLASSSDDRLLSASDDRGATWTSVAVGLAYESIRLAVDTVGGRVFAFGGSGLYSSVDSGQTFTAFTFPVDTSTHAVTAMTPHPAGVIVGTDGGGLLQAGTADELAPLPLTGARLPRLAIDGATGEVVGLTSASTVFRFSSAAGFRTPAMPGTYYNLMDLDLDPRSGMHVCVTTEAAEALICSTDAGTNWTQGAAGLWGGAHDMDRAPEDPSTIWIVVGARLLRSTDDGATFAAVAIDTNYPSASVAAVSRDIVLCAGYPDGYRLGRFDASSGTTTTIVTSGRLLTLLKRTADGALWYGSASAGVNRSRDGGQTFTSLGLSGLSPTDVAVDLARGRIYVASGGQLYVSTDDAATWADAGAPLTVLSLVVDPGTGTVFAGTDTGGLLRFSPP